MRVSDFDFDLPPELIAQAPANPRDSARLLHVPRGNGFADLRIPDLPNLLNPDDLLVVNGEAILAPGVAGDAVYRLTNYQSIPCNEALDADNTPLLELAHKLYSLAALEFS